MNLQKKLLKRNRKKIIEIKRKTGMMGTRSKPITTPRKIPKTSRQVNIKNPVIFGVAAKHMATATKKVNTLARNERERKRGIRIRRKVIGDISVIKIKP